jgi:hypothetical protein
MRMSEENLEDHFVKLTGGAEEEAEGPARRMRIGGRR